MDNFREPYLNIKFLIFSSLNVPTTLDPTIHSFTHEILSWARTWRKDQEWSPEESIKVSVVPCRIHAELHCQERLFQPTNQPLILSVSHLLIDLDYCNDPSTIFHGTMLLTIFNAKVRLRAKVGQESLLTNLSKNNYSDRRRHVNLPVFTSLGRLGISNDPSTIIHHTSTPYLSIFNIKEPLRAKVRQRIRM